MTAARILSGVLALELLWLLLASASVVFLAAHLGPGAKDFTGDATVRTVLLIAVPPLAVVLGLALIGARQGVDRVVAESGGLTARLRAALWITAAANTAVVVSIVISLYHAHATWIIVGVLLAAALAAVAWGCARTARAR